MNISQLFIKLILEKFFLLIFCSTIQFLQFGKDDRPITYSYDSFAKYISINYFIYSINYEMLYLFDRLYCHTKDYFNMLKGNLNQLT